MRAVLLLALVLAPWSASAWQAHLGGSSSEDQAVAVRFDRARNLFVLGQTELSGDCGRLTVASFTPRGVLRWQMRYARDCFRPTALRVQDDGDVLTAGWEQSDEDSSADAVVLELDGATGAIRWEYTLDQPDRPVNGGLSILGVDPGGNVRVRRQEVEGPDPEGADAPTFAYFEVLLDGATGAELSRVRIDPPAPAIPALGFAGRGVVQRRRPDGTVAWERAVAGFEHPAALVQMLRTDEAGDVYVGGGVSYPDGFARDFAVVKLAGDDGRELWRDVRPDGIARAVAFDRGHVFAVGQLAIDGSARTGFVVTRLRGDTGRTRWTTMLRGPTGVGLGIVIDPRGQVVAFGSAAPPSDGPSEEDPTFTVARLSSRTGRTDRRVLHYPPPD